MEWRSRGEADDDEEEAQPTKIGAKHQIEFMLTFMNHKHYKTCTPVNLKEQT